MGHYYVLRLNNIGSADEDAITSLLFDSGASGVSEDLEFQQTVQQFEPAVVSKDYINLVAYFSETPSRELFSELEQLGIFPGGPAGAKSYELKKEQDADWLKEWKKGYTSLALTPDFWIVPRWEVPPAEADIVFHIEPGMAFGTGTHETTQLVAELMAEGAVRESFLDVGTGTGLLAFYAFRRGFKKVVAIDNDPVAVEVAKENLAHNRAEEIQVFTTPLERLGENFEVVAANIIQSILLFLRPGLVKAVRPGGELLLSGILKEHEQEFVSSFFCNEEFAVVQRVEKGDWVAFRAQRSEGQA